MVIAAGGLITDSLNRPIAGSNGGILTKAVSVGPSPIGYNLYGVSPGDVDSSTDSDKTGGGGWDAWDSTMNLAASAAWRKSPVIGMWPSHSASSLTQEGFHQTDAAHVNFKGLYQLCHDEGRIVSVSMPLLFTTKSDGTAHVTTFPDRTRFQDIIDGGWDAKFIAYCTKLKAIGIGTATGDWIILRLGWEAQNNRSYEWSTGWDVSGPTDAARFAKYKEAFQHVATLLRANLPRCLIDYCFFAGCAYTVGGTTTYFDPDECYPGDNYCDMISVDIYDGRSAHDSAPSGDVWMNDRISIPAGNVVRASNTNGVLNTPMFTNAELSSSAPLGGNAWFLYVQGKSKDFATPEWGTKSRGSAAFIQTMYRYHTENWANKSVYEYYFNRVDSQLLPVTANDHTAAAAAWKATFGARASGFPA